LSAAFVLAGVEHAVAEGVLACGVGAQCVAKKQARGGDGVFGVEEDRYRN
jgi:hypothetical protein